MTSPRGVSGIHSNDIHNPSGYALGIMNTFSCIPDTPLVVMFYLLHIILFIFNKTDLQWINQQI